MCSSNMYMMLMACTVWCVGAYQAYGNEYKTSFSFFMTIVFPVLYLILLYIIIK